MQDVLTTADVTVTLMDANISVGRIRAAELPSCTYPLLKAMLGTEPKFFSLTQEEHELTLLMDERSRAAFDGVPRAAVEYAPNLWRAFELHLGSTVVEVPSLVCFISTVMADSRISILNLSSHDRDFLLVQDFDVPAATLLLQQRLHRDLDGLKADITKSAQSAAVRRSAAPSPQPGERAEPEEAAGSGGSSGAGSGADDADDAAAPPGAPSYPPAGMGNLEITRRNTSDLLKAHEGGGEADGALFVRVLPTKLAVVRLQLSRRQASAHALVQRLLFTHATGGASAAADGADAGGGAGARPCFWSYTLTDDEASLIVDEDSLASFPPEAIVGSSARWRPLRLCGRAFAFDETGVVSAMFAPFEEGVPLLNISTFSTNVSLVEEAELERALAAFEVPIDVVPL